MSTIEDKNTKLEARWDEVEKELKDLYSNQYQSMINDPMKYINTVIPKIKSLEMEKYQIERDLGWI